MKKILTQNNRKSQIFFLIKKFCSFVLTVILFNFYLISYYNNTQPNLFLADLPKCKYTTEIKKC